MNIRPGRGIGTLLLTGMVGWGVMGAQAQDPAGPGPGEPVAETSEPVDAQAEFSEEEYAGEETAPYPDVYVPLPEEVDALLRKMSAHLAGAQAFVFEADILFDEVLDSGLLVQRAGTLKLLAKRPNGLRAQFKSDTEDRTMWYDGKAMNVVDLDDKVHVEIPVPDTIGPALDHLMDHYGISIPLSDFLFENPYEALTADVDRGHHMGMSKVNGIDCHHLAFSQETVDWQLWIEDGDRPLPRKLVIVYKNDVGIPHYMAILKDTELVETVPPKAFNPEIPEGVVTMDILDLAPDLDAAAEPDSEPDPGAEPETAPEAK